MTVTEEQARTIVAQALSDETPLLLSIRIRDAWMILSCLQLTDRHPGISAATRRFVHQVGRQLQAAIVRVHPEADAIIEMGWDPEMDVLSGDDGAASGTDEHRRDRKQEQMSAKATGRVWDLKLSPAQRTVLLAYADHADHEGKNIEAGIPLIAWKTDYSERQVRRITRELEKAGLLVAREQRRGKPTRYDIDFSKAEHKAPFERRARADKMSGVEGGQNVRPAENRPRTSHGKKASPTPDIASAKTVRILNKEKEVVMDSLHGEIFALYESEIEITDAADRAALAQAADLYGAAWVMDAIRAARARKPKPAFLHRNYILKILAGWKRRGKPGLAGAGDSGSRALADGSRYVSGKYAALIEH